MPSMRSRVERSAVCVVATLSITSGDTPTNVVGPLIEVPVLIALVYAAPWARCRSTLRMAFASRREKDDAMVGVSGAGSR